MNLAKQASIWIGTAVLVFATHSSAAQTSTVIVTGGGPNPGRVTKSADRPQGVNSPVPALLTQAKKIFLANGGADAGLFPHPFTGTQDRAYGYFYKSLTDNKRFTLVDSPADADLVLELQLEAPKGPLGGDKQHGTEDPLPDFRLKIYDRPTHYVLWAITQTIDKATLQKTHDKNLDDALDLLLAQLILVVGSPK